MWDNFVKENWAVSVSPNADRFKLSEQETEIFLREWTRINKLWEQSRPVLTEEQKEQNRKDIEFVLTCWFG